MHRNKSRQEKMKPETKRRLAIEWLTLLCSIVVGIVAILWAKVPRQIDDYWKSGSSSAWFRDITSGNAGDVDAILRKFGVQK
jgi:hypothetical protein